MPRAQTSVRFFSTFSFLLSAVYGLPAWASAARPDPQPPAVPADSVGANGAVPQFPSRPIAPPGAPNILLVMTDDVGFGAAGTFGGLIPTPALDALALHGSKFNNFNTTAMCSPSRAALLTGRNSHSAGVGALTDLALPYPGYYGQISRSTATVARLLKDNGYSTAMFGKHHNTPVSELSSAGPYENWPTGLGFEYFYGFVASATDQWNPALVRGTSRIAEPAGKHLDERLVDDAIRWLHNHEAAQPEKPFFVYLAPGTAHAPLQAPSEWIAKFRGKFDRGWDWAREAIFRRQKSEGIVPENAVLTPRPNYIPSWNSLSDVQKKTASKMMEVYAAQLAHQDYQFGRFMNELERTGQLSNTLVIFVEGDNGGSSEGTVQGTANDFGVLFQDLNETPNALLEESDKFGGHHSHVHYPIGWAWAVNTPFRNFKRHASYLGGVRNGMVAAWYGKGVSTSSVNSGFLHLIDVAPTILDAAGTVPPAQVDGVPQKPLEGTSFLGTLAGRSVNNRNVQYFEMLGNRAIYKDGWWASTKIPDIALSTHVGKATLPDPLTYEWELYDLRNDFSQSKNVATGNTDMLRRMESAWKEQANAYNVFPLNNSADWGRVTTEPNARIPRRDEYVFWGKNIVLEKFAAPPILERSFSISSKIVTQTDVDSGVIAAVGDEFGGWSFYLKDGAPVAYQAYSNGVGQQFKISAKDKLRAGAHNIQFTGDYVDGRGVNVTIAVDGEVVATGNMPRSIRMVDQGESFAVGRDMGLPVSPDYQNEGEFKGDILKIVVRIK